MRAYRPDRVVRVLTRLVSIAYFGLLALGGVLLIGLPIARLVAGDNPDWEIGLTVPVASLDSDATVVTRWGNGHLELEDARGSLRLPIGRLPWWLFALIWSYVAAAGAMMLMFLHHLRRILQRVRGGAPFDATNALRLRSLGLIALTLTVVTGVSEFVTALAVRGDLISDRVKVLGGFSVDGSGVVLGLVLLALAEILRRGAELEDEQSMTV